MKQYQTFIVLTTVSSGELSDNLFFILSSILICLLMWWQRCSDANELLRKVIVR